jgi:hypothetical protein
MQKEQPALPWVESLTRGLHTVDVTPAAENHSETVLSQILELATFTADRLVMVEDRPPSIPTRRNFDEMVDIHLDSIGERHGELVLRDVVEAVVLVVVVVQTRGAGCWVKVGECAGCAILDASYAPRWSAHIRER